MLVLQIVFIFLAKSALVQGQPKFERVFTSIQIYDPVTGNHSMATDMVASRGSDRGLILPFEGAPCVCAQKRCKCCIGIRVKPFKIDKIVCLHLKFNLQVMQIQVRLNVGQWTGLNFTVNTLPLPTICAPMLTPPLPIPLLFCLSIHDVKLPVKSEFQVCYSLLLKLAIKTLVKLNIGCARWGKNGVRFVNNVRFDEIVFIKPANSTKIQNRQ